MTIYQNALSLNDKIMNQLQEDLNQPTSISKEDFIKKQIQLETCKKIREYLLIHLHKSYLRLVLEFLSYKYWFICVDYVHQKLVDACKVKKAPENTSTLPEVADFTGLSQYIIKLHKENTWDFVIGLQHPNNGGKIYPEDVFVYLFFFSLSTLLLLSLVSLISSFGFTPITVLFLAFNLPIVLSPLLDGYLLYIQSVKRNLINFIEKNDGEKLNELQKQGKISEMRSSSLEHDNSMFNSSQTQEKKSFYPLEIEPPVPG